MSGKVLIVGGGHVAYQLLVAFGKAGVPLAGLASRTLSKGRDTLLKTGVDCELVGGRNLADTDADVILLAVPDQAVPEVQRLYNFREDQIVAHTSGAVAMSEITKGRPGCFYPLQSMTWGEPMDFRKVPVLVEAREQEDEDLLLEIAGKVSDKVRSVSSENRLRVHLAAVFVANFTNHMFHRAEDLLGMVGEPLSLFYPLMDEILEKAKRIGPKAAQTGPAVRRDEQTIQKHLDLLRDDQTLKALYELLTKDIQNLNPQSQ
jgi:predicted short-subunit dehydrogenase-like oxidoreductase (DUF2520 family)